MKKEQQLQITEAMNRIQRRSIQFMGKPGNNRKKTKCRKRYMGMNISERRNSNNELLVRSLRAS